MPVLGVTGGVATGKTTFARALSRWLPAEVFDADACARQLVGNNQTVRDEIRRCFGPQVFAPDGSADRELLRRLVFDDKDKRRKLEQILHPAIRREWVAAAGQAKLHKRWLLVDIPLLYETHAERYFDSVAVIAAPESAQIERMGRDRGLGAEVTGKIMTNQMELGRKIEKADHVIWNNSTKEHLDEQARLLAALLKKRHG